MKQRISIHIVAPSNMHYQQFYVISCLEESLRACTGTEEGVPGTSIVQYVHDGCVITEDFNSPVYPLSSPHSENHHDVHYFQVDDAERKIVTVKKVCCIYLSLCVGSYPME